MESVVEEESFEIQATWLWDVAIIAREEVRILAFLKRKRVRKAYLQIDTALPYRVYQNFIEKAHAIEVQIYALDGAPGWSAVSPELEILLQWLMGYQNNAQTEQKFIGFHLDIEPYLCQDWERSRAKRIAAYQSGVKKAQNSAVEMGLHFEADLPFWFGEVIFNNPFGRGSLAEWVIANTDSSTVLAYRNTAKAIIEISKNEIEIASELGKKAVIAVETEKSEEGTHISFYEQNEGRMLQELRAVKAHYTNNPGFGGIAVHHYCGWINMKN